MWTLAHEWPGRVFLNPPYSNVDRFVSKLFTELDTGRTTEALVVVNACSSSAWFQALAARAWGYELRQRVKFWRPEPLAAHTSFETHQHYVLDNGPSATAHGGVAALPPVPAFVEGRKGRVRAFSGSGSEKNSNDFVGVAGFEPATTCTQSRSSTRLRYTPVLPVRGDYSIGARRSTAALRGSVGDGLELDV